MFGFILFIGVCVAMVAMTAKILPALSQQEEELKPIKIEKPKASPFKKKPFHKDV